MFARTRTSELLFLLATIAGFGASAGAAQLLFVNVVETDSQPGSTPLNIQATESGPGPLSTIAILKPNPPTPLMIQKGSPGLESAIGQLFAIARPTGVLGATAKIDSAEGAGTDPAAGTKFGGQVHYNIDDLLLTPTNSNFHAGDFVSISLQLHVKGSLAVNGVQSDSGSSIGIAVNAIPFSGARSARIVDGGYSMFSETPPLGAVQSQVDREGVFADPGQTSTIVNGIAPSQSASIDQTIQSLPFSVGVGLPFEVDVSLSFDARVLTSGFDHYFGSASADFGDTLSFPSSGPVFNLPEGLTASSAEASIVDNQAAPVPEPSALGTLLAATILLRRNRNVLRSSTQRNV